MTNKGFYIYGIVPNFYSPDMFRLLEQSQVYAVGYQNISAIVSETPQTHLNYLDRESLGRLLVKHQKTIEDIQGKGFSMFIPMKLGTIVQSKDEVIKILSKGYELIIDTLKKIELVSEIDVVATLSNFLATLQEVSAQPIIADLKHELLKNADTLSQMDQIKMGMLVQEKLKEKNEAAKKRLLESLSTISIDQRTHEVMNDEMILNAAFLIQKNNQPKFEEIIDQMDAEYSGELNFKLIGPLPCYSFYTIELKEINPFDVKEAKKMLALGDNTSVAEIKKSWHGKAKLLHPDANPENKDDTEFNNTKKSYHTLLEYAAAVRQATKEDMIWLTPEKVKENLMLVKIKE